MQARSTFLYREEAIPFITVDPKTGKFNINEEAVSLVTSIKGNIGIIAVAGLYRTGKSYLLNRMILDRSSGFGVGPSINPCTKGLWLWGTPLTGQTPEGDPLTILVVDSEGIGALDQDSFHDNRIFSLTLLLSSCFLYNSTGSIDENAIQNLSVIVNITKNIHIKSRPSGTSESDPEEYARYFPSFVWVLRDFALQLVDAQGEPLTPKEYLERTLAQQKGSSESTEQKNKIRKLLRTYFKDRDCFTLVRPLTKEENLQNLEKMDIDELRPEFSRQVIGLRRHILNKMRPKTMNNKILTGAMYAELVRSYVSAINNGAVPNIENTWSLICKSECSKVMTAAIETYETLLKDVLYNKLPLPAEELKNYHIIGKQRAIGLFRRKAIGEVTDEYLRDLIKEIKLKYFNLKLENEREFNRVSNAFIVKEYGAIERKLKNNEYKSFHDFERDVKLFHAYFLENGPNGPNKRVIISEFLQKALYDGANLFIRSSKQESEFQQTLNLDARKKLEQELNELRNGHSKEKQYLVSKISELEYEKSELEVREKNMKTSLNQLRDSKEQNETELRKEWQTEKALAHRMAEDYKAKMEQAEENLKEMERRIYLNDSEQDKQKALLKQKIEHYENMIDQNAVKEKEMMAEIKNLKKEHLSQVRESSTKYDSLNRTLQTKLEEYEQRISELEGDLSLKEQKFELDKKKWKENELNFQRRLGEAQDTVQKLQKELDEKGDVQLLKHEEYREETEMALETLNEKVRALEKTVKDKDELLKTTGNASEKEKCVLSQRNEFLELQLAEMKNQYNEMKRAYDTTLQLFEGANQTTSQEENRKIQELNELHHSEVRKLETELENTRKRLNQQMQQLTEKNNEFELQSKLTSVELNKEIESLREKVTESEQEIQQLNEQVKMTDDKKLKMVQEIEATYLQRIKDLEGDMETQARKAERQLRDIQSSSEESLLQLRNFYEMERERLERRIAEEKDKSEKKLNNLVEEYETKLKEEQGLHEEELTNLREELQEMEMKNNALVQQYESDSDLKLQTISSLENYVKETKENLSHIHTSNAQILENHLSTFATERTQLLAKIEALNLEISKRDQEISGLSQAKEHAETSLIKKETVMESNANELKGEKDHLYKALEEARVKLEENNSRFLEKKVELGRELALSQQKNEFLEKRNEDLHKQVEQTVIQYEEKLRVQKDELIQKAQEEVERINSEKAKVLAEFEKLKHSTNINNTNYQEKLSSLEKDKLVLQEKCNNLEEKIKEITKKLTSDIQALSDQLAHTKEKYQTEKKSLNEALQSAKTQLQETEQRYNEVVNNYEKEQVLWSGKFTFLENQRDEMRNNLADVQKKFEQTVQHAQKKRTLDVQETEAMFNSKIAALEKRHQAQSQEVAQNHENDLQNLRTQIKKLEKELKSEKDKQFLQNHSTTSSQTHLEKKLSDMYENEKKLHAELESIKSDRDAKMIEYQKLLDKERGSLKARVSEFEEKIKELETKKSSQIFEHDKERIRWRQEKDNLSTQTKELQEALLIIEKKRDALLRENEKLKNENKLSKKSQTLPGGIFKGNQANKVLRPTSPAGSRDSESLDKNLVDITNKGNRFNGSYLGQTNVIRTGSTSDDEGQF